MAKPANLPSLYALVKDYLTTMAYTETLQAIERERFGQTELKPQQEESKEVGMVV